MVASLKCLTPSTQVSYTKYTALKVHTAQSSWPFLGRRPITTQQVEALEMARCTADPCLGGV
jgi:hypothetical protein